MLKVLICILFGFVCYIKMLGYQTKRLGMKVKIFIFFELIKKCKVSGNYQDIKTLHSTEYETKNIL